MIRNMKHYRSHIAGSTGSVTGNTRCDIGQHQDNHTTIRRQDEFGGRQDNNADHRPGLGSGSI